jgi:hypothetical protein
VLGAAGGAVITQENIQDWIKLDEGDPRFQFLTGEEITEVINILIDIIITNYNIKIVLIYFLIFFLPSWANFAVLTQITP